MLWISFADAIVEKAEGELGGGVYGFAGEETRPAAGAQAVADDEEGAVPAFAAGVDDLAMGMRTHELLLIRVDG
jgi:hypothetical protein